MAENKEIVKKDEKEVVYVVGSENLRLTIGMVRQFIARGDKELTDSEAINFLQLCKFRKLNPFINEAYPIKFGNEAAQLIVGADAFKRKAEENPNFKGYRAGIIVMRKNDVLELEGAFKLPTDVIIGGWAEVHIKNREFPVVAKVNFSEYNKGKSTWNKIPCTMIRKVALVQALREAFPSDLGAMYSGEELGVEDKGNVQVNQEEATNEIEENANKIVIDIDIPQEEVLQEVIEVKEADYEPTF